MKINAIQSFQTNQCKENHKQKDFSTISYSDSYKNSSNINFAAKQKGILDGLADGLKKIKKELKEAEKNATKEAGEKEEVLSAREERVRDLLDGFSD